VEGEDHGTVPARRPYLRDLLEQGFVVVVAKDATAGPRHPEWGDGYQAALVNFEFLAHGVVLTGEVVQALDGAEVARHG